MPRLPMHGRTMRASELTDEEVARRWKGLTPNFFRYLGLFSVASLGLFIFNHLYKPSQSVTDVLNAAFQITCALTAYYVVLCAMAIFYSRKYLQKSQQSNQG